MQDRNDRYGQGGGAPSGKGWRDRRDDAPRSERREGRSWEPPYGDERTYGRQGQRGGDHRGADEGQGGGHGERPDGDYSAMGSDGGGYGQQDYSRSAQRSLSREGYRSGQGGYGGGEYGRPAAGKDGGSGGNRAGEGGYGQGDLGPGDGYEGVCGEGAGRSGAQGRYGETFRGASGNVADHQPYGGAARADPYDADFDPAYLDWRRASSPATTGTISTGARPRPSLTTRSIGAGATSAGRSSMRTSTAGARPATAPSRPNPLTRPIQASGTSPTAAKTRPMSGKAEA